jgi:hypothetical protein
MLLAVPPALLLDNWKGTGTMEPADHLTVILSLWLTGFALLVAVVYYWWSK